MRTKWLTGWVSRSLNFYLKMTWTKRHDYDESLVMDMSLNLTHKTNVFLGYAQYFVRNVLCEKNVRFMGML